MPFGLINNCFSKMPSNISSTAQSVMLSEDLENLGNPKNPKSMLRNELVEIQRSKDEGIALG